MQLLDGKIGDVVEDNECLHGILVGISENKKALVVRKNADTQIMESVAEDWENLTKVGQIDIDRLWVESCHIWMDAVVSRPRPRT